MQPLNRDHLSPTAVESYLKCGYKFYRKHEDKTKRTSVPMSVGIAAHKVIRHAARKIQAETGTPSPSECADLAVASYDESMVSGESTEKMSEVESGRDTAAAGSIFLASTVVPTIIQPDMIESECTASYGTWKLKGIVDLSDRGKETRPRIRDLKTGKRRKSPDYAHASGQLTAYSILFEGARGKQPDLQIDSVSYNKKGWLYEPLPTARTEEDVRGYWERVQIAEAGIKAGLFPPAPEGSWYCSRSWCEYFADCPFVSARRRLGGSSDE